VGDIISRVITIIAVRKNVGQREGEKICRLLLVYVRGTRGVTSEQNPGFEIEGFAPKSHTAAGGMGEQASVKVNCSGEKGQMLAAFSLCKASRGALLRDGGWCRSARASA